MRSMPASWCTIPVRCPPISCSFHTSTCSTLYVDPRKSENTLPARSRRPADAPSKRGPLRAFRGNRAAAGQSSSRDSAGTIRSSGDTANQSNGLLTRQSRCRNVPLRKPWLVRRLKDPASFEIVRTLPPSVFADPVAARQHPSMPRDLGKPAVLPQLPQPEKSSVFVRGGVYRQLVGSGGRTRVRAGHPAIRVGWMASEHPPSQGGTLGGCRCCRAARIGRGPGWFRARGSRALVLRAAPTSRFHVPQLLPPLPRKSLGFHACRESDTSPDPRGCRQATSILKAASLMLSAP